MRTSTAFGEIGYRVDDGDIGYAGSTHLSFKPQTAPSVAHIRATARGDAELTRIKSILTTTKATRSAGQSTTARRLNVTPEAYWAGVSRIGRGLA
ncbi:hypothetical protein FHX57_003821 [Paraburkholderia tropica]|uniref:hypothetical protein n=1 Tax=Paraburkholderia tropica TaxID=92647 RepID=UPI001621C086|nr:hypothetical protein [Paraburkholderia tropica]MBB3001464.1 hypothetical protein [Paraburkholderia tropica]MBB6324352.1 hypothetical protein [Paraburkholderia tropica]